MKMPFSYKDHIFRAVLIGSFLGHVGLLSAGSFLFPSPKYAVEEAPSSMEVVILKTSPARKEKMVLKKQVLTVPDVSEARPVTETKVLEREERQIEKQIHIPPVRGAVTGAKPACLRNPAPVYPELARERGWEGLTVFEVLVGEDGTVRQIHLHQSSGYKILDESALKTVRTWHFLPARAGNLSFSSWIRIPVRFMLIDERQRQ